MIKRQHTVANFFPEAEELRETLDASFKNTYRDRISWQYFCDPRMYAYLRTAPQKVFEEELFNRFMSHLRQWCKENLGLAPLGYPNLHLMINGCKLNLHSDFHNGVWGYVYSLTHWGNRKFAGGETLLVRDGVPSYKKHHVHGEVLYELIPAVFNQLLVFDDRIVHATPTIEGSMDPAEGRIAMVGHIRAMSPVVVGALPLTDARNVIFDVLPHIRDRLRMHRDVQGTLTFRVKVTASGGVESATALTDNLVTQTAGYAESDAVTAVRSIIHGAICQLKFPAAKESSTVTVPLLIPIPDLRRIDVVVPHALSRDAARERLTANFSKIVELGAAEVLEDGIYTVHEPLAGTIRLEPKEIVCSFDAPMWVPSQRDQFKIDLLEAANASTSIA